MNISVPRIHTAPPSTRLREVEKRTGGRYKVRTSRRRAGRGRESIEGVQLGTLDLTLTSTGPIPNFVPEVAILDIPFLFRDYAQARAVLDGSIGQEMLQKFPPKGIVALAWAENGFRHMTNSKRAVNGPDDLKGLKMRTMENPIHIQAYKQFGILPTPMAFTEVYTALQQGTVDGQENPLSVITAAKLDQVQKNLTLTGHVYSPALILMNKGKWDKLSAADKQAFQDAAKEAVKANRARIDDDEAKAVADLRAKGMVIVETVDKGKFRPCWRHSCGLRQAFRPGEYRPDQELQVSARRGPASRTTRATRSSVSERGRQQDADLRNQGQ
jgi:tripartite ATP-independent transporter DctP family solute receptor